MATSKNSSIPAKSGIKKKNIQDSIDDLSAQLSLCKSDKTLTTQIQAIIRCLEKKRDENKRANKN